MQKWHEFQLRRKGQKSLKPKRRLRLGRETYGVGGHGERVSVRFAYAIKSNSYYVDFGIISIKRNLERGAAPSSHHERKLNP